LARSIASSNEPNEATPTIGPNVSVFAISSPPRTPLTIVGCA
jgi:hypothetical protein